MNRTKSILYTAVIAAIILMAVFPFYVMIMMATHRNGDLYHGLTLLPGDYYFKNMQTVFNRGFLRLYFNSTVVSLTAAGFSVLISAMTGFALAKYRFKLRKFMFYFIVMTLMIPYQLGLIAYIIEMRFLELNNTLLPIIIPWLSNAFGVFWMTQYIKGAVPDEVLESVRIDGGSEFRIFASIVIPFIKPAVITLFLLIFLWSWNSYLLPLIVINKTKLYTVPLGLARLGEQYVEDYAARIAGLSLGTIPIIIIYIMGSKNFISGLTAGAVKG